MISNIFGGKDTEDGSGIFDGCRGSYVYVRLSRTIYVKACV